MKVKILQPITTAKGELKPGETIDVKPRTGERWIAEGLARKARK